MKLNKDQKIWFVSDTHFSHTNICKATSKWADTSKCRDFDSLEQMNSYIINNINSVVGQNDILFHLGDWSFGGFDNILESRKRIICQNIHIITGNHDHHIENNRDDVQSLFSSVNKYLELSVDGIQYILMHFPISSWNNLGRGSIHLHGHVHLGPLDKIGVGRCMDVGVEGNMYKPYSLEEINSILLKRPIDSSMLNDHHSKVESYIN